MSSPMPSDIPRHFAEAPFREVVEERAITFADVEWLVAARTDKTITYRALGQRTVAWAEAFSTTGLASGDRIGLLVPDPLDFAVCFVSALAFGLWVAPMDPTGDVTNARALDDRATRLRLSAIVASRDAPGSLATRWIDARDVSSRDGTPVGPRSPASTTGGVILATSGTTGTPKIMALATAQLTYAATLVARHNELTGADRGLNPLPLWHVNAEVVALLATFLTGSSLVLDDRFHRTDFWSLVDRLRVTWINAVPAIISRLVSRDDDEVVPGRVRFVRSASAPLSSPLLTTFEAKTGVVVIESYGMTEAASQICANPLRGPRKVSSVGPAVGVELRVVATATRTTIDAEHPGHVEIRGPSVIQRYEGAGYEDRFDAEGWLRTGDLGYLDDDGYLFLIGRSDDVINRGGEKIFPREIEDVILGVPGVVAAAVVGAPDEVFSHVPVAYVQLESVTASTPLDEVRAVTTKIRDELVAAFVRTRRPVTLTVVLRLPVNAAGKVKRSELSSSSVEVVLHESLQ
ncbi:MAG: AMP-binding protein [Acidimicrobiales bacterium]